ncbi:hypothetical protein GCM10023232_07390 [Sphingosinicella ginsenosidimutans]|uniref:ATPase n=1 Tax=Allosphingosinicella ginsenosidimutans TaxID=1176539 RepID=A0A5C6TW32_9SPHN|nr:hypothetical protein [Sphingosinicella ginsenosidimutans]TXC64567.1 hypothetical protein FRZ32_13445 [Sphingosinicella ginsenosidimutans]
MTMGAERAMAHQPDSVTWDDIADQGEPVAPFRFDRIVEEEEAAAPIGIRLLAVALIAAALGWAGFAGYALYAEGLPASLSAWAGWVATASAPLILLTLVWIAFGRTPRRESERFIAAVGAMRRESQALESVLGIVGSRIAENGEALSAEATRLMALGDEAADRLGRVTQHLARESADLERRANALDSAAGNARVDIGALLSDLPRAEQQARAAAESLRSAGLAAHEQAAALEGHLAALTARGRDVDEAVGGAAQRLGAQIARIETGAGAAQERMDQVAAQMNAAIDQAMTRAADSVEQTRASMEAQGQAMLAMVEQARAAIDQSGAEAGTALADRIEAIGGGIARIADGLAAQESTSQALLGNLTSQIDALDARLAEIGEAGQAHGARVSQSIAALHDAAAKLHREIEAGSNASGALIDRTHEVAGALTTVSDQLRGLLIAALGEVEGQAARTKDAVKSVVPAMDEVRGVAAEAARSLADNESTVARQREAIEAVAAAAREAIDGLGAADSAAGRLAQETGPQLIEQLVRVREAANQAATHAREAIASAIPDSVAALSQASRDAIAEAVGRPVEEQLVEIAASSERATEAARAASERLTRQLLAITETAKAVEDRIAEDQARREEQEAGALTRRVSLLIEALNSTAIDVNKLLSNEVADTAWASYLKGDRGVFTRRAVRLLEAGEVRTIQRHYDEEPDFRDQVNRYVHDFEAMLRRILAERDGATLGVTLLSSDMGKLYVALAQAIERLRR